MVGKQVNTKAISDVLLALEIPPSLKGFHYLKSAIEFVMGMGDDVLSSFCKVVYSEVASVYDTTPTRVERSMRTAIEHIPQSNVLMKSFILPGGFRSMTNKHFVYRIKEYIDMQEEGL